MEMQRTIQRVRRGCMLGAMLGCAMRLGAQRVEGAVVHADSLTPAAGVLVELVDSGGVPVGQMLTDRRGLFVLRATTSGSFQVRALRIGYRPITTDWLRLSPEAPAAIRLVLRGDPITLPLTRVSGRSACRLRREAALEVAQIWEEARKALTSSSLLGDSKSVTSRVLTYERTFDRDRVVVDQRTQLEETSEPRVFRSLSDDSLTQTGYVVRRDAVLEFFGPDADLLLSEEFLTTHCMRAAVVRGDSTAVALEFEPTGQRGEIVDVRGQLVLDRASSELRYLDFTYVGLPAQLQRSDVGGRVDFARIADGGWLVRRWELRMPAQQDGDPEQSRRRNAPAPGLRFAGGELLDARRDDSTVFTGRGRSIRGRVLVRRSDTPGAAARIALAGANTQVVADSLGVFAFRDVLPGRYRIVASSPALDSLGAEERPTQLVDVTDGDATGLTIIMPTIGDAWRSVCGGDRRLSSGAILRGTVRLRETGAPVAGARITIGWTPLPLPGEERQRPQERSFHADANGAFRFCTVPEGVEVTLRAALGRAVSGLQFARVPRDRPYLVVDLLIP